MWRLRVEKAPRISPSLDLRCGAGAARRRFKHRDKKINNESDNGRLERALWLLICVEWDVDARARDMKGARRVIWTGMLVSEETTRETVFESRSNFCCKAFGGVCLGDTPSWETLLDGEEHCPQSRNTQLLGFLFGLMNQTAALHSTFLSPSPLLLSPADPVVVDSVAI